MTAPKKDPRQILLSKSHLHSPEEIARMSDAQAWNAVYSEFPTKSEDRDPRPSICFTGFTASEKSRLADIAASKGLRVVTGVSQSLRYLCVGENAGPMKIEKARELGTAIVTELEFNAL